MGKVETDVDIDVFGRDNILAGIEHINGRIDRANGNFEKHVTGVYFQNIPRDPVSNMSTLDHRIAKDYGYFKIDFLNVNMYEGVRDEAHLLSLLNQEPPWDFLEYQEVTDQLFHLNGHSDLLKRFKPKSVEDLAMILAIIRPSKAYLQQSTWEKIRSEVWVKSTEDENYQFKKCHAIAYALAIVVNLNLLIEKWAKEEA
jgi:DNA polymerase III alpha subunit